MQIAVLGAGNIGGTIGAKWAKAGHTVRFGMRDPQKADVQALVRSLGANASAVSIAEAIKASDVVLFAVPGNAAEDTAKANAQALDGKILIDATNNMRGATTNAAESLVRIAPKASVYRTFNFYGWENFQNPTYGGVQADLFYVGTDGDARKSVEQLISDVGLRPIYVGGIDQVGLLDNLLRLWFTLSGSRGRHLAFKVLSD